MLAGRPCLNKKLKGHKSAGESSPTLRIPYSRTGRTTLRQHHITTVDSSGLKLSEDQQRTSYVGSDKVHFYKVWNYLLYTSNRFSPQVNVVVTVPHKEKKNDLSSFHSYKSTTISFCLQLNILCSMPGGCDFFLT